MSEIVDSAYVSDGVVGGPRSWPTFDHPDATTLESGIVVLDYLVRGTGLER